MTLPPATVLEATMLVCFGFSWPIANLRMLRRRRAEGRGTLATSLTLVGYGAGMAAKVVCACTGAGLAPIFWLYLLNAASVALNIALQAHYNDAGAAAEPLRRRLLNLVFSLCAVPADVWRQWRAVAATVGLERR